MPILKRIKSNLHEVKIPEKSLVTKFLPCNYSDSYASILLTKEWIFPDDIQVIIWTIKPKWLRVLFKLRKIKTSPFCLKNNLEENIEKIIRTNNSTNFMSIVGKSQNETILKLSDKYLDAYLSVYIDRGTTRQTVTLTTLIYYNNLFGRVYFFFIKPIHQLIIKNMFKNVLERYGM